MGFEQPDFTLPVSEEPEVCIDTKSNLRELGNDTAENIADTSIEVGSDNFNAIVDYIEKNGFVVTERGVASDHQYTFIDSNGNRHALMTIKRDADGNPSKKGQVTQISVWAYYKGIKDQDHYFGYRIGPDKITPFGANTGEEWKERSDVKFGYDEFLKKVKGE